MCVHPRSGKGKGALGNVSVHVGAMVGTLPGQTLKQPETRVMQPSGRKTTSVALKLFAES